MVAVEIDTSDNSITSLDNFVYGFRAEDEGCGVCGGIYDGSGTNVAWARPGFVEILYDGSVLISDDTAHYVFRVQYDGADAMDYDCPTTGAPSEATSEPTEATMEPTEATMTPTEATQAPTTEDGTEVTPEPTTMEPTDATMAPTTMEPTEVTMAPTTMEPTDATMAPTTMEPTKAPVDVDVDDPGRGTMNGCLMAFYVVLINVLYLAIVE